MSLNVADISAATKSALAAIAASSDLNELKTVKIEHLGDKSALSKASQALGKVAAEEKAQFGKIVGAAKAEVSAAFEAKLQSLETERDARVLSEERVDVTLPSTIPSVGGLHPLTILTNEISDLFIGLGYRVAEGPELEAEWLNFDALNIPADHPARTMQDTFFIEPLDSKLVLRTHTSPVQIRALEKLGPPLKMIAPGRVFRNEEVDPSHEHTFYQLEGMMVDRDVSVAHLIYFMKTLLSAIFHRDVTVRLRPGFFPFVEPGFELDIQCLICAGKGCPVCKQSGWVELLPCGLVHPAVLKSGGLDPDEWNGFAFGLGLTRLAMMRYAIDDIRLFASGDLRFLNQF